MLFKRLRIFQDEKILSTPSFGREVKQFVPCRIFAACKRTRKCMRGSRSFRLKLPAISRPSSSSFHYLGLWWRHLAVQVGTTKDQGLYNKPSAAVHPGALAAGTLLHTYIHKKKYTTAILRDLIYSSLLWTSNTKTAEATERTEIQLHMATNLLTFLRTTKCSSIKRRQFLSDI